MSNNYLYTGLKQTGESKCEKVDMLKSLSLTASTPGWSVGLDQGLGLAISHLYINLYINRLSAWTTL